MRNRLLMIIFVAGCCKNEPSIPKDYCQTCSSAIEINNLNWASKPYFAWFDVKEQIDTFFDIEIDEINPKHDLFSDALLLWNIPYEPGEYKLSTLLYSEWNTHVAFEVYEVEYGTATENYWPVYDESSVINVKSINKATGEFSLDFNLKLYPGGNPNGEIHNSSYPLMIQVNGSAQGIITYK